MKVVSMSLDDDTLEKLDQVSQLLRKQYGDDIYVSRSAVIRRAVNALFLSVCHLEVTKDTDESQAKTEPLPA